MPYTTNSSLRLGPEFTPDAIKKIILYTCLISGISAITNNLFVYIFEFPGPMDWLSLSWWGMKRYLWWEPVTFLFTHHTGSGGINFFFLLTLFFNMYVLWVFGTDVFQRVGKASFLRFYFTCGILAALIAFFLMPLTNQYGVLSGATPSILALLVVWTLFNPESELLLFFLIPVKAKWLLLGVVLGIILINLSNLNIVGFTFYFSASVLGYLYGILAWGLHSPFPALYRFELGMTRLSEKVKRVFRGFGLKRNILQAKSKDKVVDIRTGKPLKDEEEFLDAMLEKISKHGEHSLTQPEKERMDAISKKRRKEKRI